jgi:hypothetical protein
MRDVKTVVEKSLKLILARIEAYGFLLESDAQLPSVCSLIAGEPVRGSWWSHPKAQLIFEVNEALDDREDVLLTKLVSRKVTWVHRQLWSDLVVIGGARVQWQMKGLSKSARTLLDLVNEQGIVRTDEGSLLKRLRSKPGDPTRELEKRLLIVSGQVHTETGAHAKVLESWNHWTERLSLSLTPVSLQQAMDNFQTRLDLLNTKYDAKARLPWN